MVATMAIMIMMTMMTSMAATTTTNMMKTTRMEIITRMRMMAMIVPTHSSIVHINAKQPGGSRNAIGRCTDSMKTMRGDDDGDDGDDDNDDNDDDDGEDDDDDEEDEDREDGDNYEDEDDGDMFYALVDFHIIAKQPGGSLNASGRYTGSMKTMLMLLMCRW